MQRIEIGGMRFGHYTVKQYAGNNKWLCVCDCGTEKIVPSVELRQGRRVSCGCARPQILSEKRKTHGYSRTPTYESWCKMVWRCTNPKSSQYKHYGGRGITVCERWLQFENFLADMGERPSGKTLDRINVDGNYEPSNCRWATHEEQMNNTHRSVRFQGKTLKQWASELGMKYDTLSYRLRKHGTIFI